MAAPIGAEDFITHPPRRLAPQRYAYVAHLLTHIIGIKPL